MEGFDYYNPVRLIFGPGVVGRVGAEAAKLGKVALVVSYEEHAVLNDLLERVGTMITEAGARAVPFYAVSANPTLDQVRRGIEVCRTAGADFVVAVGGGSAMDAAKLIAAGVLYPGDPWEMVVSRHDRAEAVAPVQALPLLMVPTLPATSSEMNCGAVVTNEELKEKSYVFAECLYPRISIIDPALTCSLPPYQTACGAADAISHAMETYLNGVGDTPLQDAMLEGVIRTTMDNVHRALANPQDLAARTALQWAAVVAWNGWAQCGAGGWAPMHQWGHVLSARHGVTHGASLAIIMPAYMRYQCRFRAERYAQFAERIFGIDPAGREAAAVAAEGIERFEAFLREIGVPTRLDDVKIKAEEIDAMTEDVVRISFGADGRLNSNPPMARDGVRRVYELAMASHEQAAV